MLGGGSDEFCIGEESDENTKVFVEEMTFEIGL